MKTLTRFGQAVLALLAIALLLAILYLATSTARGPLHSSRDLTESERAYVARVQEQFKLKPYFWAINRETGEISYIDRKGNVRVIE